MASYSEFLELGFPIIALICFILLARHYFLEAGQIVIPSDKSNLFVTATSAYLIFTGIFLAWGPALMARMSTHLVLLGISGIYGISADKRSAKIFFVVFGAITALCLIGSASFLTGVSQKSFVDISSIECSLYFNKDVSRCKDSGYIMFCRVIGVFAIFATLAAVVSTLFSIADDEPSTGKGEEHAGTSLLGSEYSPATYAGETH